MNIIFLKRYGVLIITLIIFLSAQFLTIPMMTGKLIGIGGLRGRGNLYWSDSEKIISLKKEIPTELWSQFLKASIKTGTILELILIAICSIILFFHIRLRKQLKRNDYYIKHL
jgi:hypothetical protein